MAKLYTMLIKAGRKTLDDVPQILREEVAALLSEETTD